ncbi:hypothetical protein GCM10009430_37430 [Aquimarina litoralis]|uniref:Uncharacterized protein n=1 Tax=Aquimarina litoralis TaxID=584605 RepID=A0ABN1J4D3_9FLAO
MKTVFLRLPEFYFITLAILVGYSPPFYIHPIFIGVIGVLILQIVYKKRVLGITLGSLFFLINIYFFGALLSEFREFTEFNNQAKQLIFVGLGIWIANFIFSSTMIYKYAKNNRKEEFVLKEQS